MRKIIFLLALIYSLSAIGQVKTISDHKIDVVYSNSAKKLPKPAYFLNGKLIDESILTAINPNEIDSVNVDKKDFEIDNKNYYGKISITTKSDYNPKLISLNQLKLKYINLESPLFIFLIDDKIINANYNQYLVDENNILQIMVDNIDLSGEKLNLSCIKIITKSQENIKKSKEIRIR